jgi:hypothetical protein
MHGDARSPMGVASTTVADGSRLSSLQRSSSHDAQSSLQRFHEPHLKVSRSLLVLSRMSLISALSQCVPASVCAPLRCPHPAAFMNFSVTFVSRFCSGEIGRCRAVPKPRTPAVVAVKFSAAPSPILVPGSTAFSPIHTEEVESVGAPVTSASTVVPSAAKMIPGGLAQAAIVARLRAQYRDRDLVCGDAYYLVDAKWFEKWEHTVGYSSALEDAALMDMLEARKRGDAAAGAAPVPTGAEVRTVRCPPLPSLPLNVCSLDLSQAGDVPVLPPIDNSLLLREGGCPDVATICPVPADAPEQVDAPTQRRSLSCYACSLRSPLSCIIRCL